MYYFPGISVKKSFDIEVGMNRTENKRVKLTKELLRSALLEILKEVPIREVSIRELCKRAGVNRTTFYNHYGNQYDLFDDIGQQFLNAISQRLKYLQADDMEMVHKRVAAVLDYFEENRECSVLLFNNSIDSNYVERIMSLPEIGDLLDSTLAGFKDQRKKEAVRSFTIYGSQRLLQEWIRQDERAGAEEEAALILEIAGQVCRAPQGAEDK